jgi:beta-glucosidase
MAGYPEIEDVPAHASEKWITAILRQELGFKGIVVSEGDGFGTLIYEGIVPTQKEAGILGLKAGVDLNITYEPAYMGPLIDNVNEGRVPMELIDRAVRRVLELKFRLGLFEHPSSQFAGNGGWGQNRIRRAIAVGTKSGTSHPKRERD